MLTKKFNLLYYYANFCRTHLNLIFTKKVGTFSWPSRILLIHYFFVYLSQHCIAYECKWLFDKFSGQLSNSSWVVIYRCQQWRHCQHCSHEKITTEQKCRHSTTVHWFTVSFIPIREGSESGYLPTYLILSSYSPNSFSTSYQALQHIWGSYFKYFLFPYSKILFNFRTCPLPPWIET